MGRILVKASQGDKVAYFEWSTIVDAPVAGPFTLEQLKLYIAEMYGAEGVSYLPSRLKRCDLHGHSALDRDDKTWQEYISFNRAGDSEAQLTPEEFWERYVQPMFNQCDGCRDGRPVDERGLHRMGDGVYPDYLSCQAYRYK